MEYPNPISRLDMATWARIPVAITLVTVLVIVLWPPSLRFEEYVVVPLVVALICSGVLAVVSVARTRTEVPAFIELRDDSIIGWFAPAGPQRRGGIRVPFDAIRAFIGPGAKSSFPVRSYARAIGRGSSMMPTATAAAAANDWRPWLGEHEVVLAPAVFQLVVGAWTAWSDSHPTAIPSPRPQIVGSLSSL
jgi:hypothetical protein